MKQKQWIFKVAGTTFFLGTALLLLCSCNGGGGNGGNLQSKVDSLETELKAFRADKAVNDRRLADFDVLDFDTYTHQKWDSFGTTHTDDVKVFYPDGSISAGLTPGHIDKMKVQFTFAPDTKILSHPVKFGSGDWTAVVGVMEGTFSKPIQLGGGKSIAPTGKKFKLQMVTIGHWKEHKMFEEYLFWDNQNFSKQIGLAP